MQAVHGAVGLCVRYPAFSTKAPDSAKRGGVAAHGDGDGAPLVNPTLLCFGQEGFSASNLLTAKEKSVILPVQKKVEGTPALPPFPGDAQRGSTTVSKY